MRVNTTKALIVGLSIAAAGLLSACTTEQSAAGDPSATSTPPASSTSASAGEPAPTGAPEPTPGQEGGGGGSGVGTDEPVDDGKGTDCGPVDGVNGPVDLIAVSTDAGIVGCTEAINVITEYFQDAPTKGQGTAYTLTVDGWSCLTDTGAQGSGAVGCDKDGLAFHTQP
jgi:hypothetical protein